MVKQQEQKDLLGNKELSNRKKGDFTGPGFLSSCIGLQQADLCEFNGPACSRQGYLEIPSQNKTKKAAYPLGRRETEKWFSQ